MIPFGLTSLMTLSLPMARRATKCVDVDEPIPGASALWLCNDGAGQVLTDYSGNGYNGTLGSTAGDDTNDPAWAATGLTFDADDFATAGATVAGTAAAYSAIVVFKRTSGTGNAYLLNSYNITAKSGFRIYLNGGNCYFGQYDPDGGGTSRLAPAVAAASDAWHIATGIWDGAALQLVVDDVASAAVACAGYTASAATPITFGRYAEMDGSYFTGGIAYAAYYPFALTPAQVARTHAALKALVAPRGVVLP